METVTLRAGVGVEVGGGGGGGVERWETGEGSAVGDEY